MYGKWSLLDQRDYSLKKLIQRGSGLLLFFFSLLFFSCASRPPLVAPIPEPLEGAEREAVEAEEREAALPPASAPEPLSGMVPLTSIAVNNYHLAFNHESEWIKEPSKIEIFGNYIRLVTIEVKSHSGLIELTTVQNYPILVIENGDEREVHGQWEVKYEGMIITQYSVVLMEDASGEKYVRVRLTTVKEVGFRQYLDPLTLGTSWLFRVGKRFLGKEVMKEVVIRRISL